MLPPLGRSRAAGWFEDPAFGNSPDAQRQRRHDLIVESAYWRSTHRDFDGDENDLLFDWLEAESEIDARLVESGADCE